MVIGPTGGKLLRGTDRIETEHGSVVQLGLIGDAQIPKPPPARGPMEFAVWLPKIRSETLRLLRTP
jgi:hypothetical protein